MTGNVPDMETTLVVTLALMGAGVLGIWLGVAALRRAMERRLGTTDAELRRLGDAGAWQERGAREMRQELAAFRSTMDRLHAREEERRAREEQSWAVLHRVASVLSGGQRTGRAGENVLREALAHLPPSMVVTDFRVNGKVVELGLVLPDGRRLPIDSKWPAEREVLALETAEPDERERLVRVVERTVAERAREVAAYLDPAVTAPVGVAAIPDAAYRAIRRAHADAYRQGVVVVPYSMALPVVLFMYTLAGRFGTAGDVEGCLADLGRMLEEVEAILENKVARASAMLTNGTEEIRGRLGKARASLSRARAETAPAGATRPEPEPAAVIRLSP